MSSAMGTFVDRLAAVDLAALVGQPTRTMSFVPSLLLAVAPAWYLSVGKRAPLFQHGISTLNKLTLALVALATELHYRSARSKVYDKGTDAFLIVAMCTITTWSVSFSMLTGRRFLAGMCLDIVLSLDALKTCLFIYSNGLALESALIATLSIAKAALFLPEAAWLIYEVIPPVPESAAAFTSIWHSPFRLVLPENMEGLGDEFKSMAAWRKFNAPWSQVNRDNASRFALLRILLLVYRWELAIVCTARFFLAIANVGQLYAVYYALTVMENEDASFFIRCQALCFSALAYFSATELQRIYNGLVNRLITLLRGSMTGQVLCKLFRLRVQDGQHEVATTTTHADIDEMINNLPGMLEVVASALELSGGVSFLWLRIANASFWAVIPSICIIFPSSKISASINTVQTHLSSVVQARISQSIEAFRSITGTKMIGSETYVATYLQGLYTKEIDAVVSFRYLQKLSTVLVVLAHRSMHILVLYNISGSISLREGLTPSVLFTALMAMDLITEKLEGVRWAHQRIGIAMGCYDRLQAFYCATEYRRTRTVRRPILLQVQHSLINDSAEFPTNDQRMQMRRGFVNTDPVQLHNITVKRPDTGTTMFRDVSISVPRGKLTVILGSTGSGKSQLLKVLLDETQRQAGQLFIERGATLAYCRQTVWLYQRSIKDNILDGNLFKQRRYNKILHLCQLTSDISALSDGDATIMNRSTSILSTRQQYKIMLARAIYSPATVLLLDDPFRFMDAITAKYVFMALVGPNGFLRKEGKTVILATRFQKFMAEADLAVFLDGNGRVITREAKDKFFLSSELRGVVEKLEKFPNPALEQAGNGSKLLDTSVNDNKHGRDHLAGGHENQALPQHVLQNNNQHEDDTLLSMLRKYGSTRLFIVFVVKVSFASLAHRLPDVFAGFWLQYYSQSSLYYIGFVFLSLVQIWSIATSYEQYFSKFIPDFSKRLYETYISTFTDATFAHLTSENHEGTTKSLNQDIVSVTRTLAMALFNTAIFVSGVSVDVIILAAVPGCTAPVILCTFVLIYLARRFYMANYCQLKVLEKEAKSRLLAHMTDISTGVENIRASGSQVDFMTYGLELLDRSQMPFFHGRGAECWLSFVLSLLTASTIVTFTAFGLFMRIQAGKIGLMILVLTSFSERAGTLVKRLAEFQTTTEGLERLHGFITKTPVEPTTIPRMEAAAWANSAKIDLVNVTAKYGRDVAASLGVRNVSFVVESGQKATLVGSAGSGKSSCLLAILNFLNYSGSIKINSIEVSSIPVKQLRSRISVLPQLPIHLPGTIEQNLLPWRLVDSQRDQISNRTIQRVLEGVGLWDPICQAGGLKRPWKELKLSDVEQTQFSTARLILHHIHHQNTIVLMDEFPAKLNPEMRQKLEALISKQFETSTVLKVSHGNATTGFNGPCFSFAR